MLKKILLIAGLSIIFAYTQSFAAMVSVVPTEQTIRIGETASVDIILSDYGDADPELTEAQFELAFDNSILSFVQGSIWYAADPPDFYQQSPGFVYGEILGITQTPQPTDDFVIATLIFTGTAVGESQLDLNQSLSTFIDGTPIQIDAWSNGSITVVPVPPAVLMLGSGLIGMLGIRRRMKK
jgi:hypothetical protein